MTKSNYRDIFEKTRQLVNEWDPRSLIESGSPIDEYDSLSNRFLSGVINDIDTENLNKDIIYLLDNYYGTPVFNELSTENQELLKKDIKELIEKIKKLMPTIRLE